MSFLLADDGTGWPRITSCDLNHAALAHASRQDPVVDKEP